MHLPKMLALGILKQYLLVIKIWYTKEFIMKFGRICLIILALTFSSNILSIAPYQKLYGIILGSQEASSAYQSLVQQALEDYKVSEPERVCVKQMNWVGSSLVNMQLHSFTAAGGIWLNEELLNQLSSEERMFIIYHEVAHYVYSHHPKMLLSIATPALLIIAASIKAKSYYPTTTITTYLRTAITPLAALGAGAFTMQSVVRAQEKKADLVATRILVKHGKSAIVEGYMRALQAALDTGVTSSSPYHASVSNQLAYISQYYALISDKNVVKIG